MAKQYRVGGSVRFNNAVMRAMLRMGLGFRSFAILVVAGRKTGRQIRTPIVVFRQGECRYLVAPYGIVNWVRNLRAAEGRAELIRGRRTEPIIATELPPEQAAPILGESLRAGPPGVPRFIVGVYRRFLVLPFLDVDTNSSLAEFERAVSAHPVFLVRPG
jgi:hypothetical protein